jgi:hypothetical protein
VSGGVIAVGLAIFERLSGKNVTLSIYVTILLIFLFLSCYLAWTDAQKEIKKVTLEKDEVLNARNNDTREFIIENLRDLIKEGVEVRSYGALRHSDLENWGKLQRREEYRPRVERFLEDYLGDLHVQNFREKGEVALEEILRELMTKR